MAREADIDSVRQRALVLISSLTALEIPRDEQLEQLRKQFDIGARYAETLYATYRTENMNSMTKVFTVKDVLDGEQCVPYIKVENVFKPDEGAALTAADARKFYEAMQNEKIKQCRKITVKVYEVLDDWEEDMEETPTPYMDIVTVSDPAADAVFTPAVAKKNYLATWERVPKGLRGIVKEL